MPKRPQKPPTEVIADPENDRPQRRRFTREEKLAIVREAEASTEHGAIAALLRREGLYSSQLSKWRRQFQAHGESGLEPARRGPKPTRDERDRELARLKRRNARRERELEVARGLLDLAGKAHAILGVALPSLENDEER